MAHLDNELRRVSNLHDRPPFLKNFSKNPPNNQTSAPLKQTYKITADRCPLSAVSGQLKQKTENQKPTERGPTMKSTIHETIRRHRKAQRMSQRELADRLGVSYQAVSKWERGINLPDLLLVPDLCSALGISADELLDMSSRSSSEALTPTQKS